MKKKRLPYKEGSWFAAPLQKGGYGVGRVARHSPKGVTVLAYFFGPKRGKLPSLIEIENLHADDAVWVRVIGDLGLMNGSWPIIGDSAHWDRDRWSVPVLFRRVNVPKATAWRVEYSNDDPEIIVCEERIPYDSNLPDTDGCSGAGAAEKRLTALLDP